MRAIGFDTETTGLVKSRFAKLSMQPHITEFFGLVVHQVTENGPWSEVETFHSLFDPGTPLDKDVQRITGLTDKMLANEPKFVEKAHQIKSLLESCDIVFAHNLGFDMAMVDFEMERAGIEVNWSNVRMVCTVEATEHFKGRRLKLIELHEHLFGEGFENAHRAENDVRPMVRCFIKLWEDGVI